MPAIQLSDAPATLTPYDVVASGDKNLPTHVMLFVGETTRQDVTNTSAVPVSHMGPPLKQDSRHVQFVGSAELNSEERRLVKDFVDTHSRTVATLSKREKLEQYVIHQDSDEISPDDTLPRFSCATYVTSAYEQAAIQLVDNLIPMQTLDDLKNIYTERWMLAALDDSNQRVKIGIGTGTSWPIIMVGYLLHSLSRSPADIRAKPYRPTDGDHFYPRNPPTEPVAASPEGPSA